MILKLSIKYLSLAYLSAISVLAFMPFIALAETLPLTAAAEQIPPVRVVPPGFYQFNNLEIFKGPEADEIPTELTAIQKSSAACAIYEGGNPQRTVPCPAKTGETTTYTVKIEERTALLGNDREPAVLSDFTAGDKINVLGWLSSDGKTISAAVVRNLELKKFHQRWLIKLHEK